MTDERRREAWRLHVQQGMPVKAIAETLGVPVGTVKAWLHRDRRRGVQHATDDVSATDTDTATGSGTATATDASNAQPATDTGQVALVPPPPDALGRPYISLIATFGRHGACPACHKFWPSPRWDSSDAMRRLVVMDLRGDGAPRERLLINLLCKSCADAGPKGSVRYAQVIPASRAGECVDCSRNPRDLGPDEYVRCIDNKTRCLKHAVRWWCYAGQVDYPDRPCVGCGRTDNLYVCEDGQVRCRACLLRAWRRDREGTDALGRGLPLGL